MAVLTLHPMKEIRVIVSGEHRPFVTELLDKVEATGYTIIGNISGKGHHGVREAHFMFSEQESLVMIMAVVPEERWSPSRPDYGRCSTATQGSCSCLMCPSAGGNISGRRAANPDRVTRKPRLASPQSPRPTLSSQG
ncbi:MAG: hypothetical protein QM771_06665 [Nitrospira sp.]